MKRFFVLIVLAALAVAVSYVAGYWPERRRTGALEAEKAQLQQRLDAAEARVRAGALLGELLTLKETVQEMNYGQARGLSSPFFDHVRAEAARTTDPTIKQTLDSIQLLRDPVTVALTQGDVASSSHLREAERRLRVALGYPPPPPPPPPAASTPALPAPSPITPGAGPVPGPTGPLGFPTPTPAAPPTPAP